MLRKAEWGCSLPGYEEGIQEEGIELFWIYIVSLPIQVGSSTIFRITQVTRD